MTAPTLPVTDDRVVVFALMLIRNWGTVREQTWARWVLRENAMRAEDV